MGKSFWWWPFVLRRTRELHIAQLEDTLTEARLRLLSVNQNVLGLTAALAAANQDMARMQHRYARWCDAVAHPLSVHLLQETALARSWEFPPPIMGPPAYGVSTDWARGTRVELHQFGVGIGLHSNMPPERVIGELMRKVTRALPDCVMRHYRAQSALMQGPPP